jgi:hypothetical protein
MLLAMPTLPVSASPAPGHSLPGCTTVYGYDGGVALAGNNEDFNNPLTRVWFVPASPGRFGCVYFGYEDGLPQGGLNDQGVFFDALALPYKATPLTKARPDFPGGEMELLQEILSTSATAEDAVEVAGRWNRVGSEYSQLFYGDRSGHSAIIDGDTVVRIQGRFQLATNFRITDTPDPPYPEERYGTLLSMFEKAPRYDVELFRQAMDVAHQEGDTPTLYTQVYELDSNTIHLFQFHDFEHEVVLHLDQELAKGPRTVAIASLFPENAQYNEWANTRLMQWEAGFGQRISAKVDVDGLAWMCGDYVLDQAPLEGTAKVFLQERSLYLQIGDQLPVVLYPAAADTVFHQYISGLDLTLQFQGAGGGHATGAQGRITFAPYNLSMPYDLVRQAKTGWQATLLGVVAVTCIAAGLVAAAVLTRRRRAARTDSADASNRQST